MSSIEGQLNRASRKYLTKIGYLTEKRPQLFLNGTQLQGIAVQQRSKRKFEGINEAADREFDIDFYMPSLPKSKGSIRKKRGAKEKHEKKGKKTN